MKIVRLAVISVVVVVAGEAVVEEEETAVVAAAGAADTATGATDADRLFLTQNFKKNGHLFRCPFFRVLRG